MKKIIIAVLLLLACSTNIYAKDYVVKMLDEDANGGFMVFEPAVLHIKKGDSVKFLATDGGHNTVSIDTLTPKGSQPWNGKINEEVTLNLKKEGVYVYKCQPHTSMAMVGVIVVGKPTNLKEVKTQAKIFSRLFIMNKTRLNDYLSTIKAAK